MATTTVAGPLGDLDEWDEFLEGRYKEGKSKEEFRVYDAKATPGGGGVLSAEPREPDG